MEETSIGEWSQLDHFWPPRIALGSLVDLLDKKTTEVAVPDNDNMHVT